MSHILACGQPVHQPFSWKSTQCGGPGAKNLCAGLHFPGCLGAGLQERIQRNMSGSYDSCQEFAFFDGGRNDSSWEGEFISKLSSLPRGDFYLLRRHQLPPFFPHPMTPAADDATFLEITAREGSQHGSGFQGRSWEGVNSTHSWC